MLLLLLLLPLLPLLWAGSPQKDPEYELQVQDSVTVQAGLCVHVPCKVSYPREGWNDSTPAFGYWYQKREAIEDVLVATNNQGKKIARKVRPPSPLDLSGDPGAGDCSLSLSAARPGHSGKYYFRLERGPVNHTYWDNPLTVTVTALTQTPDIRAKEPLEAGRLGHLVCSLPGACAPLLASTFSWAGAAALRTRVLGSLAAKSPDIVFKPRPQDHGTNLTCQLTFPGADVSRTITLNVSYAPQNLTIRVSRGSHTELEHVVNGSALQVREGDSLRLLCVADSNPPATLSWAQRGQTLRPSQPQEPGVLELPRVEARHEGKFTCRAQHRRGSLRASLRLLVQNPPQLLGPSCSWGDQGLHCSCSSRAQPAPSLRWRLGAGLLEGNHGNASHVVTSSSEGPWTNSSLSLKEGLSPDLRLSCEAWNVHGTQSASVLLLPEEKDLIAKGFSKGVALGTGVTILLALGLCLCLILAVVKTLRKTQTQTPAEEAAPETEAPARTEAWRPRLTRRSTILDYINVVPNTRGLARNPKAKTSSPSRAPPAAASSPGRNMSPPAPESRNSQQEIHYAALRFPGLRPQEAQQAKDTNSEYAEIRFY